VNAPGALVGLAAASGLLLILLACTPSAAPHRVRPSGSGPTARQLAGSLLAALVAFTIALAATALLVVAVVAGVVAGAAPFVLRRRRATAAETAVREAWPDVIDDLLSSVRAGLSLPEAVAALGVGGPAPLRPAFSRFADQHRASAAFDDALDALQADLADPVADRVCAALRLAREVGGTDLGAVLAALSSMLREDGRIRREVAARQSWTVAAARLAVAAPWITLALLCTRPEAVRAYSTTAGTAVLVIAAMLSVAAYVAMRRIGRLPADARVAA
jgi:tight adherence protein B